MLRMCVYMHSHFVENHPIRILEDGPLIFEVVLSHLGDCFALPILLLMFHCCKNLRIPSNLSSVFFCASPKIVSSSTCHRRFLVCCMFCCMVFTIAMVLATKLISVECHIDSVVNMEL
jgi:hypothetical protein